MSFLLLLMTTFKSNSLESLFNIFSVKLWYFYFERHNRKLLSFWQSCQISEIKINAAELKLKWTDMFLSALLFCLFNIVMSENKLTSVDFEIFGNVQGKLFVTCHMYVCLHVLRYKVTHVVIFCVKDSVPSKIFIIISMIKS